MRILCMHIVGLIPFKSSIDHPIALLCFFNTSTSLSSCNRSRCEFIMAGHLLSASRKTYFKFSGSCFNSAPFLGSSFYPSTKGCLRSSHRFCLELLNMGLASIIATTLASSSSTASSLLHTDELNTLSKGNCCSCKEFSLVQI